MTKIRKSMKTVALAVGRTGITLAATMMLKREEAEGVTDSDGSNDTKSLNHLYHKKFTTIGYGLSSLYFYP